MKELIEIIEGVVDLKNLNVKIGSAKSRIEITNAICSQTIIIQSTEDGIWVRLRAPNSGYFCESNDEFRTYIDALINNRIEVCVGYKKDEWVETIIVPTHNHDEMKSNLDYQISYWPNPKKH